MPSRAAPWLSETNITEGLIGDPPVHQRIEQQSDPMRQWVTEYGDTVKSDHHLWPTPWMRKRFDFVSRQPSRAHHRATWPDGSLRYDYVDTRWRTSPQSPNDFGPPAQADGLRDNAYSKALTQARNGLARGDFDFGVAIGEARESAELLAKRGEEMAHAIQSFRRHANSLGGSKARALGRVAGAWLEGYYGWGSMARDAFALYDIVQQKVAKPLLLSSRGRATEQFNRTFDGGLAEEFWEFRNEVKYYFAIDDAFKHQAASMGLINPLGIAWELTGLSFVVDWFIPIGNVLNALTADAGLTFRAGYATRTDKARVNFRMAKPFQDWDLVSFEPGEHALTQFIMYRAVLQGFEPPRLYANTNPFNTNRIASAAALVTQAIFGSR